MAANFVSDSFLNRRGPSVTGTKKRCGSRENNAVRGVLVPNKRSQLVESNSLGGRKMGRYTREKNEQRGVGKETVAL